MEDAPVRTVDPGRLDTEDRKLLLDQVVDPTDRDGHHLRQEIRARLDRHVTLLCGLIHLDIKGIGVAPLPF